MVLTEGWTVSVATKLGVDRIGGPMAPGGEWCAQQTIGKVPDSLELWCDPYLSSCCRHPPGEAAERAGIASPSLREERVWKGTR